MLKELNQTQFLYLMLFMFIFSKHLGDMAAHCQLKDYKFELLSYKEKSSIMNKYKYGTSRTGHEW